MRVKYGAGVNSKAAVLKEWSVVPLGVCESKPIFHNNTKVFFAFLHCVDICIDDAKAVVGKTDCTLIQLIQGNSYVLVVFIFKSQFHLRMYLKQ